MKRTDLLAQIALGEDSTRQFKADVKNADRTDPSADYATLAERLEISEATVKRNIQKLKLQNRIRRIGSKKTGHWEVME